MRRDISVCRMRKAAGLSCHNCMYFLSCPEAAGTVSRQERRKKPVGHPGISWTEEQLRILEDLSLTTNKAAEKLGITVHQVRWYRKYNGLVKYRRRGKKET